MRASRLKLNLIRPSSRYLQRQQHAVADTVSFAPSLACMFSTASDHYSYTRKTGAARTSLSRPSSAYHRENTHRSSARAHTVGPASLLTNIPKVDGSNSSIPIRRHVDRSSKSSTNKVSVGSHNSIDMVEEFGQAFVDDVDRFCANVMIDKGETFGKALRYNDATQREATTNILKETSMLRLLVRRLQEMRAVDETKRDVLENELKSQISLIQTHEQEFKDRVHRDKQQLETLFHSLKKEKLQLAQKVKERETQLALEREKNEQLQNHTPKSPLPSSSSSLSSSSSSSSSSSPTQSPHTNMNANSVLEEERRLSDSLQQQERSLARIAQLEAEIQRLMSESQTLSSQVKVLEAQLSEKMGLLTESETLRQELAQQRTSLTLEARSLTEQVLSMTKTKEEENKQNEENRENAREFASLQMQQLQQMQQFKTEQEQEVEALQQQLAKATGLLAETEEDVEHRRAELEEEVSKLSSENEKLRSSLKNASESEQALSAAQKKDKLKIQDMEKEMYLYTETLKKKEQFIQELQFQLEDVEASMNVDMVSPEEFEKVSEANKSLQSNLDAVKEKIQAERDLYKEHVQQLEEHMKALQSAVDGHEMERSKTVLAQEYLYDANQQLLKAESAWAEAEEKEMALRARLQSAEQREEQNRQTGALEAHVRELELQVARMKTQQEQDAEKEKVQDNMEALAAIAINEHPIYGKQLLDTGYKSVYATPIRNLIDPSIIPIWEKQRSFRVERADRIAKAIARKDDGFVFPGTIVIYSFDKEGLALEASRSTQGEEKEPPLSIAHGVLDGQHRIGAIRLLVEQGLMDPETPVLTEVFSINTQKEAAKLFREINQAEPVKLVDIPEDEEFDGSSSCGGDADSAACTEALAVENAIASSRVLKKEIIDGAVNQLVAQYPDMFKPSSRCRKPHLNIDNLRDELYQSNILETIGLTTDEELYQWMEARNTELQNLDMQQWYSGAKTITNTMEKAYSKSLHHKFFLGMGYGWLYK